MKKKQRINVNKIIVHNHPELGNLSLKWRRCANRYNHGSTIFGKKYLMRSVICRAAYNSVVKFYERNGWEIDFYNHHIIKI
jgi:hypothetical protein